MPIKVSWPRATALRGICSALLASAAEYLFVIGLVQQASWTPPAATHLGYVVGAAVNFMLNRHWAYKGAGSPLGQAARYALVSFTGGFLAARCVALSQRLLHLDYRWVVPLAYGLVSLVWNLPLQGAFVFARPGARR